VTFTAIAADSPVVRSHARELFRMDNSEELLSLRKLIRETGWSDRL
jgi:hypothetical protein